jgi:hypothetical protein
MGHFSMEKSLNPGSVLGGNQQQGDLEAAAVDRWWSDLERSETDGAFFAGFLGFMVCGDSGTRDP